ncbi:MAG: peptidoglycan-binding protein LysM [Saprospiraceae bacterium]|jgi:nucleoid-associated protein YgaU|nr:peptidoglycan-binding protein LysM [Saprospiraceae bacterium]MBK7373348.1 peptidoglycan-binding protein LysM [Saprospiraceae bacterium]MBK7437021.1 peptidoglycan-binding protein LysM [Saprospiraceae bacterium]MBK8283024.1 peptidoglycan-binding protein LysM [Saprospiraceae bacterium]MBK8512945.1 peptidoglycan-binding protein LysM [Saprospiraceae bacterium]
MGLFSFLKGAGEKLFGSKPSTTAVDAEAAAAAEKTQKIAAMQSFITGLGLDVQNLDIDLDGDVVTVYGQAVNQAEKEKLILALGNVQGVASVDDRVSVIAAPEPEADLYEVKSGDSLSKISKHFYGDPMRYNEIFEANKPLLSHPDKIYPGQMLRIPR